MINKDKQRYIYLRSTKERVPVTEQEFNDYYRDINAYRRTKQNHGKCVCPKAKWLDCDMNCETCPFRRAGDSLSLDYTFIDEDGIEKSWIEALPDDTPLIEEIVSDEIELKQILVRIGEIMPEAIEIGTLRQQGMSERTIEEKIGVGRKTYAYRIKKLFETVKKEFPDFF